MGTPIRALALIAMRLVVVSAHSIACTVVDDDSGVPVQSATARLSSSKGAIAEARTDAFGRFLIGGLAQGGYRIEIAKANHIPAIVRLSAQMESLPSESSAPDPVVRLIRYGVISGVVVPAQGGSVLAFKTSREGEPSGSLQAAADLNSRGEFRLSSLPPGRYEIGLRIVPGGGSRRIGFVMYPSAAQATEFTITGGEEYAGIVIPVPVVEAVKVSGRVSTPGGGRRFPVRIAAADYPSVTLSTVQTEASGGFEFDSVLPGTYDLFVSAPGAPGALFGRAGFQVSGFSIENIEVALVPGRTAGFVLGTTGSRNVARLCGLDANLTVTAEEAWATAARKSTHVTRERPAIIEGLAPGRYRITLQSASGCDGTIIGALDLTDGSQLEPLVVTLVPPGHIQGMVVGEKPGARLAVVLVALESGEKWPVQVAFVDAGQEFSFDGLPTGRYSASASPATEQSGRWAPGPASRVIESTAWESEAVELRVSGNRDR